MATPSDAANKHLASLVEAVQTSKNDQVVKFADQYLALQQDPEIAFTKIVALAKLDKYQQAYQLMANTKIDTETSKFLKAYLAYKLGHFQEAIDIADSTSRDANMNVLKAQVYCKRENYEMSCNIMATLINEKKKETESIFEDICANFFNSLALHAWTLVSVDTCNPSPRKKSP